MDGLVRFQGFKPEEELRIYVNTFIKQLIDANIPVSMIEMNIEKKGDKFESKCVLKSLTGDVSIVSTADKPKSSVDEIDRIVRRQMASNAENSKFHELHFYGLEQN